MVCSNARFEAWLWPNAAKPMLYRKANAVPGSRCCTGKLMLYREADDVPGSRCCTGSRCFTGKPMQPREADVVPGSWCCSGKPMLYREADAVLWSWCCTGNLIVFAGTDVPIIYILLCPSKDWQSTVGWGDCWIWTQLQFLNHGVATKEPPLLPQATTALFADPTCIFQIVWLAFLSI